MDDKTVDGWLGLFVVVWRLTLGDLRAADWMVRVRSAEGLSFVLLLMLGARENVAMRTRNELPVWRRINMGVAEMARMLKTAIGLDLHDKLMPARLPPGKLPQGLKRIRLSAFFEVETAVNPVTDGEYEGSEELLADVAGWIEADDGEAGGGGGGGENEKRWLALGEKWSSRQMGWWF